MEGGGRKAHNESLRNSASFLFLFGPSTFLPRKSGGEIISNHVTDSFSFYLFQKAKMCFGVSRKTAQAKAVKAYFLWALESFESIKKIGKRKKK